MSTRDRTGELVAFLASLRPEDVPDAVLERVPWLFLDWVGCALAGKAARPVRALLHFARRMGPPDGPSEVLADGRGSSPFFAALVNAAASHVVEQDDVHSGSVTHPGTVVFPALLAAAQALRRDGRSLCAAAVVGYEAMARVGAFLGRSHYRVFHTTATAGVFGAAAAVAHLLGADETTWRMAFGSAGTQAAGLWQFLRDGADSKQLHAAKAAADGLLAAYLASEGFTGAVDVLEGEQGLAAGTAPGADPRALNEGLGERWAVLETSLKWHASCRHTHPAADALLEAMGRHSLGAEDMQRITALVHQAALDVLAPAAAARNPHQAKFSMPFVLSLVALRGHARHEDFDEASVRDPALRTYMARIDMRLDAEVDRAYPERWAGGVEVETRAGQRLRVYVSAPRGDPEWPLSHEEVEAKFRSLARWGGVEPQEVERIARMSRKLAQTAGAPRLLPSHEDEESVSCV